MLVRCIGLTGGPLDVLPDGTGVHERHQRLVVEGDFVDLTGEVPVPGSLPVPAAGGVAAADEYLAEAVGHDTRGGAALIVAVDEQGLDALVAGEQDVVPCVVGDRRLGDEAGRTTAEPSAQFAVGIDQQHRTPTGGCVTDVGVLVSDQDTLGLRLEPELHGHGRLGAQRLDGHLDRAVPREGHRGVVAVGEDSRAAQPRPVEVAAHVVVAERTRRLGTRALTQTPVPRRATALDGVRVGGRGGGVGGCGDLPGAAVGIRVLGQPAGDTVVGGRRVHPPRRQGDLGELADGVAGGVVLGDGRRVQRVVVEGDFVHLPVEVVFALREPHPAGASVTGPEVGVVAGLLGQDAVQGADLGAVQVQGLRVDGGGEHGVVPLAVGHRLRGGDGCGARAAGEV